MATSYTGVFGGNPIQPAQSSYSKIELVAVKTQLSWPTSFVDVENVVTGIIEVDPTLADLNLYFPNAQLASLGTLVIITNISTTDSFNVMKFGSTPLDAPILTSVPGSTNCIYLTNNTDTEGGIGGTWTAIPYGAGSTAIASISFESDDESLVIDNGVINNTGEVVQFDLANNLNALGLSNGAGIAVQDGANGWIPQSIAGMGNNITVDNGFGTDATKPINISLSDTLNGLLKVSIAELVLENNTVSSTLNNDLNIKAANTKNVLIGSGANQVTIDQNGDITTAGVMTANAIGSDNVQGGNLQLTANNLISTDNNGLINIIPNGIGNVVLGSGANKVTIESNGNLISQAIIKTNTLNPLALNGMVGLGGTLNITGDLNVTGNLTANNYLPFKLLVTFNATSVGTDPTMNAGSINVASINIVSPALYQINFINPIPLAAQNVFVTTSTITTLTSFGMAKVPSSTDFIQVYYVSAGTNPGAPQFMTVSIL